MKIYNLSSGIPTFDRAIGVNGGAMHPDNDGFSAPIGVAVANNKLYVSDKDNHRIQIYNLPITNNDLADRTIGTGSSVSHPDNTGFKYPFGVVIANGRLYVADLLNHRVQIYTNLSITPNFVRKIGTGVAAANNNGFNQPRGVAVADGKLYVSDQNNHRVQVYDISKAGAPIYKRTIGKVGSTVADNTGFNGPSGVALDGSRLYVSDVNNHRVQVYTNLSDPAVEVTLGTGAAVSDDTGFNGPVGLAFADDRLYVSDETNDRIQVYEWK